MADLIDAAGDGVPAGFGRFKAGYRCSIIGGLERAAGEHVLDIHQDQLLMLLLVLQAKFDQGGRRGRKASLQQAQHRFIDMAAIGPHLIERRAAEEAALRARMALADAHIITVELNRIGRIESAIAGLVLREEKRLEEPARMRQMPFGRAGVRHRLDLAILRRQGCGKRLAGAADLQIALNDVGVARRGRGCGHGPIAFASCSQTWKLNNPSGSVQYAIGSQPDARARKRASSSEYL